MCDLIFVESSVATWLFEDAIRVKSTYDKTVMENKTKRRKYGNQRNVYVNVNRKYGLGIEFTAC